MRSVSAGDSGFQLYLSRIQKYPPLDREQELTLSRQWLTDHDRAAAEKLVKANLRFVVKIARATGATASGSPTSSRRATSACSRR